MRELHIESMPSIRCPALEDIQRPIESCKGCDYFCGTVLDRDDEPLRIQCSCPTKEEKE